MAKAATQKMNSKNTTRSRAKRNQNQSRPKAKSKTDLKVSQPEVSRTSSKATVADVGKRSPRSGSKLAKLIDLLERSRGTTLEEAGKGLGWQRHSIRGAISSTIKKKLGLPVESEVTKSRGRVYRIVTGS